MSDGFMSPVCYYSNNSNTKGECEMTQRVNLFTCANVSVVDALDSPPPCHRSGTGKTNF